ncbi:NACHT domain-containing protein [Actinoallomurus acaciae]|uniref:NACHT domain-containing protein n=1 Tax=Actinoallomurus acaciae TaxID=502577 RepID=A0ABV5YUR2_9ACTN
MKRTQAGLLVMAGAAALVAGGVATNQVVSGAGVSWTWAYLALGFTVLGSVLSLHLTRSPAAAVERWMLGRRRTYLRQLRASVADMETIGVVTHGEFVLRMRQVYVDVALRPRPPQELERDSGLGPVTPQQAGDRRPLQSFLRDSRVFAVIGASGSGKTTLARHTALAMCGRHWRFWRRRQMPVLLYLRDHVRSILAEQPPFLPEVASSAGWLDGRIPPSWLGKRFDRGRCVILLDGLDEVADEGDRATVVRWLRRQIERYPANTFVITSRPHGYSSNPLPNADVLQVQRFTAEQISEFLRHWSYAVECRARNRSGGPVRAAARRQADDLLRKLRSGPAMYELAANPLLLTMIANVHRYRGALPRSRADLYSEMCDALLHRRQEAKNLADATGLEGPKKVRVLRHLALRMMRERTRDMATAEAEDLIKEPLRHVTGQGRLTPAIFLDEVRKNGVLVGGEHGACGFVHLSIQEYLAAACIRAEPAEHLRLLTEGVNDPWWRETTLLWAAGSNATPVIDACLASGTIDALALAFDCADEALEIDPATRARLNRLLTAADVSGGDDRAARRRLRLIAAVTASRGLREIVWHGTTAVCAQPISRDLYNLFVLHERGTGRHTPRQPLGEGATGRSPAVGMWADDAARFVGWLNTLLDEGPTYRLPAPAELAHPDAALTHVLGRHTVWAADDRIVLHRPDRVPWPYAPGRERLGKYPGTVLETIRPALRLAQIPRDASDGDLHHLLAYTRVLTPRLGADPLAPTALEWMMTVDRARDLADTLDLVFDLAADLRHLGSDPEPLATVFAIATNLGTALWRGLSAGHDLALVLDRAGHRGEGKGLEQAVAHARALAGDLAYAQSRPAVTPLMRDRVRDLRRALAVHHGTDLAHDLERCRDHARAYARSLGRADALRRAADLPLQALHGVRRLDRGRARRLELDLPARRDTAHDVPIVRARDLTGRLIGLIGLLGDGAAEDDLERRRRVMDSTARAHDLGRALNRELNRALACDVARGLTDPELLPVIVPAAGVLLRQWTSPRGAKAGDGQARTSFERFVAKLIGGSTRGAEDPGGEIRKVLRLLSDDFGRAEVRRLLVRAHAVVAPILDRRALVDESALAAAATGLLAAIALLQGPQERDLAGRLARALGTLTVLADRGTAASANQIVLLVRA